MWACGLLIALALPACRKPPAPPPPAPAVTDDAEELAAKAEAAMDRGDFAAAGELYQRALAATSPDAVDPQTRFQWKRNAALAWWLAQQLGRARDAMGIGHYTTDMAVTPEFEYFLQLASAMPLYYHNGWPPHDPERLVDVVHMAQAGRAMADLTRPSVPPGRWVDITPQQARRIPEILATWVPLEVGESRRRACELVAAQDHMLAGSAATRPEATSRPEGLCYRTFLGDWMCQSPVVPADSPDAVCRWWAWMLDHPADWPNRRIAIGLFRGADVLARWQMWQPATPSRATWALLLSERISEARFTAGLKVIDSAMPDGATPVADRRRADMVVETFARLHPNAPRPRILAQDNFFWVLPAAGARQTMIPIVAGWLAYHDWNPPAATQPATTEPDDVIDDPPTDPTEP